MANIPTIQVRTSPPDLVDRLRNAPRSVPVAIATEMDFQNQLTIDHITERRMTGKGPFPVLEGRMGVRSARMRRSLRASKAAIRGTTVVSAIGSNLSYMGIHEFGGVTKPHMITARGKKALRFTIGGKTILRRSVKHPGSKIPARRPIYHGISDRAEAYGKAFTKVVLRKLGGDAAAGGQA